MMRLNLLSPLAQANYLFDGILNAISGTSNSEQLSILRNVLQTAEDNKQTGELHDSYYVRSGRAYCDDKLIELLSGYILILEDRVDDDLRDELMVDAQNDVS